MQMESDMPWEGNIKIRVQAENAKMTLALRIPGWCKNYKISGIEHAEQEEKRWIPVFEKSVEQGRNLLY